MHKHCGFFCLPFYIVHCPLIPHCLHSLWFPTLLPVHRTLPAAAVAQAAVPDCLPALAALARMHHFAHAANLHETIWKQLPVIADNVGKKVGF